MSADQPVVISILSEKDKDTGEYRAFVRMPDKDVKAAIPEALVKV